MDRPTNIMIIDDTPANLKLLEQLLRTEGYHVFSFPNGELAIKSAINKRPDLIFLDINMPQMNGYEVCKALKSHRNTFDIPIIFISALHSTMDKVKAFNAGGVDYVSKPFEIEEVRARLKTHLKIHELESKLRDVSHHLGEMVKMKVAEVAESQYATIIALARLAESRDDDIGNHIERVKTSCKRLAQLLSVFPEYKNLITPIYIENLSHASLLHDIGKVAIEDAILKKPERLTISEFERMKEHTTIGADTLKVILEKYPQNKFISMGLAIANYHHEKWNGTGYPGHLSGISIPLPARVMSIVDVYDALRSKRCYKDPFTHDESIRIIQSEKGISFDPLITDIFVEHHEEFRQIYDMTT
ncbi:MULTISPECIES: two-component system response regulator [unclassified Fusibacter]|uniref:response regulator n=1 Tax=unclassified Fusibacter TaxID=2624464 RepID=UPI0019D6FC7F|nr:response regulator [Fusibacter sp. A1]MCK8060379.1 response regulator [Fusibacter sp. A2]